MSAASVRTGVHIAFSEYLAVLKEGKSLGDYAHLNEAAKNLLDQLTWWGNALKAARAVVTSA